MLRTICTLLFATVGLAAQVSLSVQVLNKPGGKQVEALTAADFSVWQGERKLEIAEAGLEERALDLVIVVDERRWDPVDTVVQDSLGALASRLHGDDRVGLLVAGAAVTDVVPPGSAPGELAGALSQSRVNPGLRLPRPVPNERGPVLYDAVLTAAEHTPEGGSRRRAVLVIGLGYDNSSQSSIDEVVEAALRGGVIVSLMELPEETFQADGGVVGQGPYGRSLPPGDPRRPPTVGVPPFPTPRPRATRAGPTLAALIERTGGEHSDDWHGGHGLSAMADRLRTRYQIALKNFDARFGDVEVRLEGAAAKKNKKAELQVLQPMP